MTPLDEFLSALRQGIDEARFASLVLSKNRHADADLQGIRARPIELRGRRVVSFVHRYATRDETRNLEPDAAVAAVAAWLDPTGEPSFAHAILHAGGNAMHLRISKKGRALLSRAAHPAGEPVVVPPPSLSHDRPKRRALSLELPFLVDLGITDERHRLVPAMARKWKQIDKFLEVLDHALDRLPLPAGGALRVVDFGCGKGYLTFAVHEHLRRRFGGVPQVTGVELRAGLVELCNRAAETSHCDGLRFVQGDLRSFRPEAVDVMIALHACDTATDHAIDLGLRAGARVLVCSPCCHKELRPQMTTPAPLGALFRHGIHLGQEAEMVTDSLRALLLEAAGYEAQVFEFVSLEHTSKNKMILATRRDADTADTGRALAQVDAVKAFYGVREQCLEQLLRERIETALGPARESSGGAGKP